MSVTITLPDDIEMQLLRKAEAQHRSVEELALDILTDALEAKNSFPTPEEVAAKIQATPPTPMGIHHTNHSLAEALRNAPQNPDFDLDTWQQEWRRVETEMKAITRANLLCRRARVGR